MSYDTLEFSIEDGIARITLHRPDDANALNNVMARELFDASIRCATTPGIRAVLWTGAGRMFSGGGDLAEIALLYSANAHVRVAGIVDDGVGPPSADVVVYC